MTEMTLTAASALSSDRPVTIVPGPAHRGVGEPPGLAEEIAYHGFGPTKGLADLRLLDGGRARVWRGCEGSRLVVRRSARLPEPDEAGELRHEDWREADAATGRLADVPYLVRILAPFEARLGRAGRKALERVAFAEWIRLAEHLPASITAKLTPEAMLGIALVHIHTALGRTDLVVGFPRRSGPGGIPAVILTGLARPAAPLVWDLELQGVLPRGTVRYERRRDRFEDLGIADPKAVEILHAAARLLAHRRPAIRHVRQELMRAEPITTRTGRANLAVV